MIIIIEGIDGSGKSSLADALASRLVAFDHLHFPTRGNPAADLLPFQEVSYYLSDFLLNAPENNQDHQIWDRSFVSTSVYQKDAELQEMINACSKPLLSNYDILLIYLRCSVEVALERLEARGTKTDAVDLLDYEAKAAKLQQLSARYDAEIEKLTTRASFGELPRLQFLTLASDQKNTQELCSEVFSRLFVTTSG